jgi:hypothetical protein
MEKNEMGGACSRYGKRRSGYRVWWGSLMERDHLEDQGVEREVI